MKKGNVIFFVLLGAALLLSASCARQPLPDDSASGAIGFDAAMGLLQEGSTKSTLVTGPNFADGASIRVFCRRVGEGQNIRILESEGSMVTWDEARDKWTYSPESYWHWVNASNYYDFLAAYPDPDGENQSHRMTDGSGQDIPGNLAIEKPYQLSEDYDLMLAGTRRTGVNTATRSNLVPLTFQHMLCAVKVNVKNESSSSLTLNAIQLDNLVRDAKAKATMDAMGEPEFSWIDTQRRSDVYDYYTETTNLSSGSSYTPSEYTLFIPADLTVAIDGSMEPQAQDYDTNEEYEDALEDYLELVPHLIITYNTDQSRSIPLLDIQKTRYGTDDPISIWEPGMKYVYNITIRLDGKVLVTVITTQWDEVAAETPGLLIE